MQPPEEKVSARKVQKKVFYSLFAFGTVVALFRTVKAVSDYIRA
jgi:hypothetical protein